MQTPEQLKKAWPWLITVIMVIAIFLGISLINNADNNNAMETITVNGKGEIKAVPDVSRFTATVEETAKDQKTALANTSTKINAVIDGLKKIGIDEKDIKTEYTSTYPKYEYGRGEVEIMIYPPIPAKQTIVGYTSSHTLSVKVRNLDLVPQVQQLFADQKVTNVSGPELSLDDPEQLQLDAREAAIIDAREQAKVLAKQLGVRLGDVVSFSENGSYPMYMSARADMAMESKGSAEPVIATGEQAITSNVSITYRIK